MAKPIVSETDTEYPFWYELKDLPIFCGFTDQKRPVGIDGIMGIAEAATTGRLGTYDQAKAIQHPYVGLSLLHPLKLKPDIPGVHRSGLEKCSRLPATPTANAADDLPQQSRCSIRDITLWPWCPLLGFDAQGQNTEMHHIAREQANRVF